MPLKMFQSKQNKPESTITHVIGIAAGKGGVGKSTLTVNLALALKQAGYAVGIMDMDIYGPSVRRMLPEDQMPVQKGEQITPAVCQGIRMISMAYFRKEAEATAVRAPIANGLVHQFLHNIIWGNLDFLLIDFPPGTGDIQLTLSQQANLSGALIITTPQEVAVMDVRKAINLFDHVHVPIIGIVENMSYYQESADCEKVYVFGKGGGEKLAQEIGAPFLGSIPIDSRVCQCCDEGVSLLSHHQAKTSAAAAAFHEIAENLVAHAAAVQRASQANLSSFELQWKDIP